MIIWRVYLDWRRVFLPSSLPHRQPATVCTNLFFFLLICGVCFLWPWRPSIKTFHKKDYFSLFFVLKVCSGSSVPPPCQPPLFRWESGRTPPCSAPCWTPPPAAAVLLLPPPPPSAGTGRRQDRVLSCFWPSGPPTPLRWSTAPVFVLIRSRLQPTARCCCAAPSGATQRFITAGSLGGGSRRRTQQEATWSLQLGPGFDPFWWWSWT